MRAGRVLLAFSLLFASVADAAVPQRLNYQGKLANASGDPLSGQYSFAFRLYAAETGGSALFSESVTGANALNVVNGIYSVAIGSFTTGGIPYGVFDGQDLYLEIDVNSGNSLAGAETLTPRERLNASAWAVHALGAERLGSGPVIATFTSAGNLLVPFGVNAASGAFSGSVTASSGTFRATGSTQYSVATSSGISVGGTGGVVAAFFNGIHVGDGSRLTGIAAGENNTYTSSKTFTQEVLVGNNSRIVASSAAFTYGVAAGSVTATYLVSAGSVTIDDGVNNARLNGRNGVNFFSTTGGAGQLAAFLQGAGNPAPNYITLGNINPGFAPTLGVAGSDTNISLELRTKGSGDLVFLSGSGERGRITSSGAGSFIGGLTTTSGTFTSSGNSQYSLQTSSGISVGGTGGVTAAFFDGVHKGDGSRLTGVTAGSVAAGAVTAGTFATGVLLPAGSLTGGPLASSVLPSTVAYTSVSNTFSASNAFSATGNGTYSVTTSSGISVGGTGGVTAAFFDGVHKGSGAGLTGVTAGAVAAGNVTAGTFGTGVLLPVGSLTGTPVASSILPSSVAYTSVGNSFSASNSFLATGAGTYSVTTSSGISVGGTGGVTASFFEGAHKGDGSALTTLNASNLSAGTVANARLSGAYTSVTGLGTQTSQLNLNNVALNASGANGNLISQSSITTAGGVFATRFVGDGSGLTGVSANSINAGNIINGPVASSILPSTVAYTSVANTFTANQALNNVSLTASGSGGVIVSGSSITTAGGFFGNGSGLTGVTATTLGSNGSNCSAGSFPLGVDASGNSETCTTVSSLAPTLTGSGASGTWGISVSGNAATVSNGAYTNASNSFSQTNAFTNSGNATYSLTTSSGISVGAGGVTAAFFNGAFKGDGSNIINLNASSLSAGTVPNARLSGAYTSVTGLGTQTSQLTLNNVALNASGASGNLISQSSITTAGGVFATRFSGDGGGLTNVTATTLGSNGSNCSAGSFPLGVDASGNSETCTTVSSLAPTLTGTGASGSWGISVTGNAGTATNLAANGGNCSAGSFPLGVDAAGAAESCTTVSSLAPTLTGTGASGTWGISITGTAGAGSNLAGGAVGNIPYQTGSGATAFLPTMAANGIVVGNGAGVIPSTAALQGTASQVTVTKSATAITLSLPSPINVNTSGTAASLGANGSNCSAGSFPLGVDASGNSETCTTVSSLAPTLTGSGASGTWGINITGSAAGAPPTGTAGGVLGGTYPNPSFANNTSYPVAAADGNGLKFWGGSDSYKISMGNNATTNHYGPVTDYSIAINMDGTAGRGVVFGSAGVAPVAGINVVNGNAQFAGTLTTGGSASVAGNLTLTPANPSITSGSSYISIPNGLYISGSAIPLYSEANIRARNGISNDTGATLTISGGTSGNIDFTGAGTNAFSGVLGRTAHAKGYFVGSYNNVGSNDAKTNPIYTIGSSYVPTDTALSNMYGIGFSHSNFWGAGKSSGWGLYQASGGTVYNTMSDGGIWTAGDMTTTNTVYFGTGGSYKVTNAGAGTFATSVFGGLNPTSNGVGVIGTSSLHWANVHANAYFSNGGAYSSAADLAERYPASEPVEPGDVVVFDRAPAADKTVYDQSALVKDKARGKKIPVSVKKSASAGQEGVVGVVSTRPGLIMSDVEDEKNPPVALAGRVPVKVTGEAGPIAIGDLLAASSKPGFAMKAGRGMPTVGIALQAYDGKQDAKILCFVRSDAGEGETVRNLRKHVIDLETRIERLEALLKK